METTKSLKDIKKMVGKCFILPRTSKNPDLYLRIKKYNPQANCYVVEGFAFAPYSNIPIKHIFQRGIKKPLNFYGYPYKEIDNITYDCKRDELCAILN